MKRIIFMLLFIAILIPSLALALNSGDSGGQITLDNPIGESNPNIIIGKVIEMVLGVVGSLALLMFVYGGFTWMLSAGNNEKVQKGKEILIWATIGLIVIFSAYAMIKLIFQGLGVE